MHREHFYNGLKGSDTGLVGFVSEHPLCRNKQFPLRIVSLDSTSYQVSISFNPLGLLCPDGVISRSYETQLSPLPPIVGDVIVQRKPPCFVSACDITLLTLDRISITNHGTVSETTQCCNRPVPKRKMRFLSPKGTPRFVCTTCEPVSKLRVVVATAFLSTS